MDAKDYTCRCDAHTLKPLVYCEMCMLRTRVQNVCEDARKAINSAASQVLLKMSVIDDIINNQEEQIKFLKIDFQNMRKELSELQNDSQADKRWEYISENMKVLFTKLSMNPRESFYCKKCSGTGKIFIHPISDCGQTDQCPECGGKGKLWI